MNALSAISRVLFGRMTICTHAGALVGIIAGFVIGFAVSETARRPSWEEIIAIGSLSGLTAWLLVVLFFGLLLHYGVRPIAVPALINALLIGILTTFFGGLMPSPLLAILIGLIIGLIVGALLCTLCRIITTRCKKYRSEILVARK